MYGRSMRPPRHASAMPIRGLRNSLNHGSVPRHTTGCAHAEGALPLSTQQALTERQGMWIYAEQAAHSSCNPATWHHVASSASLLR